MGAWRSVNDIHAQAGDELFEQILAMIERKISGVSSFFALLRTMSGPSRSAASRSKSILLRGFVRASPALRLLGQQITVHALF